MDNAMAPEGWTAVPNDLLDNMSDLGNAELRVLLALIRKTAGYQKERDRVSVSQLTTMTGLTSRNAQAAVMKLLEGGYIGREQTGKQAFTYFIKPYPLGTRLNHNPTGQGEETISPRDTEPYPLGTRFDEKPYPLGTTQKKDLKKKEKDRRPASDDAVTTLPDDGAQEISTPHPTRPPKRQSAAPEIPPAPIAIRQVIATGSQIDLKTSTQASIIQVNKAAKAIWYKCRKPEWDEAETVKRIRWAGRWVRQTQYPYSEKAEQRISPSKLVDLFTAAMEAYEKAQAKPAHLNGTNGQHTPAPLISIQDAAKRAAEYAKQYDPFNERGGT